MILMLNCSLKPKASNTEYFLSLLKKEVEQYADKECRIINIKEVLKYIENGSIDKFVDVLKGAKAFVIGAPLYVDGLPSQAVYLLELLLENYRGEIPKLPVYVVSNLGFYEAKQIKNLLSIVENWCDRMGMAYGGGLAIGAGPMVRALEKMSLEKGLLKDVGKGLRILAKAIVNRKKMKNYYAKTLIPRVIYMQAAHVTFRKSMKEEER